jgi:hypothetical protein
LAVAIGGLPVRARPCRVTFPVHVSEVIKIYGRNAGS